MLSANVYSRPDSFIEALFTQHRQRACRYARWLLNNESDAEEVVQEAFLRLAKREFQNDGTPGNENRFAGLLFTTVRNLSIDLLRKKGRRKDVALTKVNEPFVEHPDEGSATQLSNRIAHLIDELPTNWAETLKLKVTGELSYEEIASVVGCTKAQVRTWIFRARKRLAKELTKEGWLENET